MAHSARRPGRAWAWPWQSVAAIALSAAALAGCSSSPDAARPETPIEAAPRAELEFFDGAECLAVDLGGPEACEAETHWVDSAELECSAQGMSLTGFAITDPCGNGWYRYMEAACCPSATPERPQRAFLGIPTRDTRPL